jgi:hypothetical protein
MIYAVALLTFLTSSTREIEIPMNISSHDQRNAFFATNLPKWECDFTQYWSNHSASRKCNDHCSKALVIDGFQKPDRFVCQFSGDVIQSPELGIRCIATHMCRSIVFSGEIEWGCGIRPEMIRDKNNPGFWSTTTFCPKHIHQLECDQSLRVVNDAVEYDSVDCNVSR